MENLEKVTAIVDALKAKGFEAKSCRKNTSDRTGYWFNVVVKEGRPLWQYNFFIADEDGIVKFLDARKISGRATYHRYSRECEPTLAILKEAVGIEIWEAEVKTK